MERPETVLRANNRAQARRRRTPGFRLSADVMKMAEYNEAEAGFVVVCELLILCRAVYRRSGVVKWLSACGSVYFNEA